MKAILLLAVLCAPLIGGEKSHIYNPAHQPVGRDHVERKVDEVNPHHLDVYDAGWRLIWHSPGRLPGEMVTLPPYRSPERAPVSTSVEEPMLQSLVADNVNALGVDRPDKKED